MNKLNLTPQSVVRFSIDVTHIAKSNLEEKFTLSDLGFDQDELDQISKSELDNELWEVYLEWRNGYLDGTYSIEGVDL